MLTLCLPIAELMSLKSTRVHCCQLLSLSICSCNIECRSIRQTFVESFHRVSGFVEASRNYKGGHLSLESRVIF